jgi:N-6 DNA Methylase
MYPDSRLSEQWEYYVRDADRAPVTRKPVREITFLDPAQGSGHFHLEAFDLFYAMYEAEAVRAGRTVTPREICATILNHNLFGIDIDGRSVQIATAALWMKAKEKAPDLEAGDLTSFHDHLVATNIRLPKERNHLELFLRKHPEDEQLRPALELVFQGLEHADELGSLLQIEQLVEGTLRRLKEEGDKSKGTAVEQDLFHPTLVQGTLPVGVEDYDQWRRDALARLRAHLAVEARAAEPAQAFFGESASTGLTFFNLLSQRYDVVTANPPYMGSKNMGDEVKAYVQHHFVSGKRDLYAAFILRCVELARPTGRVAMVTQQSWMFLRSFAELRAVDAEKLPCLRSNDFKGLLRETMLETMVHLGEHAFEDSSAAGAFAAIFTLAVTRPHKNHRLSAFRITGPKSPVEKIELLRQSLEWSASFKPGNERGHPVLSQPRQIRFLDIAQSPLSYWLPEVFMEMMHSIAPLSSVSYVRQGICTTDNSRFVRNSWEVGAVGVKGRWVLFAKGGGAKRWSGFDQSVVDWQFDGIRVKSHQEDTPGAIHWKGRMPDSSYFFKSGWTFSRIARGNLALREMPEGSLFGHTSPAAIPFIADDFVRIGFWLNTRIFSFLLRSVNQSVDCQEGYVQKLPLPDMLKRQDMAPFVTACSAFRREINRFEIHEWLFDFSKLDGKPTLDRFATEAVYATLDGQRNAVASAALSLGPSEMALVADDVGIEAGQFPVLKGYDALPPLTVGLPQLPPEALASLGHHVRSLFSPPELADFKRRLQQLFEAGPGASSAADDLDAATEENDEEEETLAVGARLPIPAQTFIEELSQKLEVHPISIYWLLKEGIEREGWRCSPEERRLTEDRSTVLVLRLLGHRWPKQIEAEESLPAWADEDGVIPLTSGGGETSLIDRVRKRLAEDFPGGSVASLEREFHEAVGSSLGQWLSGPFFEGHVSQFKKRPIAWQLETDARGQRSEVRGQRSEGRARRRRARKPRRCSLVSCTITSWMRTCYRNSGRSTSGGCGAGLRRNCGRWNVWRVPQPSTKAESCNWSSGWRR